MTALVHVLVVLRDGREVVLAHEVDDGERLSADEVVMRVAHDGVIALSDTDSVDVSEVERTAFTKPRAPKGPPWERGLRDEDADAAAGSDF